jgi:hypothetical protein
LDGLFLAGSHGWGRADQYSDLDFVLIAEPDLKPDLARKWRETLDRLFTVVFCNQWNPGGLLVNAITDDWLRIDVFMETQKEFAARDGNAVRSVIDPLGLHSDLQTYPQTRDADLDRVQFVIQDFIRVLGLLYVCIGRREYYTIIMGVGLLRDNLMALMMEETGQRDTGGILHLSKVLSSEDMGIINDLPFPGHDRDELIAANIGIARVFMPRAKALAKRLDIEWPTAFEAATLQKLKSEFGAEFDVSWP